MTFALVCLHGVIVDISEDFVYISLVRNSNKLECVSIEKETLIVFQITYFSTKQSKF